MSTAAWKAVDSSHSAEVRERIIDAAERCFVSQGLTETTIEDVASAAQYSRASVYRYFTKDELFVSVVLRKASALASELVGATAGIDDPVDAMVEGIVHATERFGADALITTYIARHLGASRSAGRASDFHRIIEEGIAPVLESACSELRPEANSTDFAQWLARIVLSLVMVPSPGDNTPEQKRAFVRAIAAPICGVDGGIASPRAAVRT